MRYGRRDSTERDIFQALRAVGCQVLPLDKIDALVLTPAGRVLLLDCKTPLSKQGRYDLTPSQKALLAAGWPLHCVTTREQALALIGVKA